MKEILLSGPPGTGKTLLILKILKEGGFENVVWVTTIRSAKAIRNILKNDNVWIVDSHTWSHVKGHPRDVVISNPLNLNEVNLGISRLLDSIGKCLVIFDSLSGLLLYHNLQKVIYFLRGVLVKIEEKDSPAIFTYVKGAHDRETEFSLYTMFPTVIEILNSNNRKRIVKVVKATEWVEPSYGEAEIVKDDIILPENIMNYIMKVLKS